MLNTANGEIAKRIDYDEYGNALLNSGTASLPFGYAGGLYDSDTKLVRFGARDYDSYTGRWTAKDPIGFGGGSSNLYQYCTNEPVNNSDPGGLWDPRGHTMLTAYNMRSLGFSEKLIDIAVAGNLWVDRKSNFFNDAQHGMFEVGSKEIMGNINYYFNQAVEAKCKRHNDEEAARMLGIGLHTLQDFWAHLMSGNTWNAHIAAALGLTKDLDVSENNPISYMGAYYSTLDYLNNYLSKTGQR